MTGTLLRICEALLSGGGPTCRAAARKLAVVCFSAFSNREAPAQGFEGEDPWVSRLWEGAAGSGHGTLRHACVGRMRMQRLHAAGMAVLLPVQAACLRLNVEPATAAALAEAVGAFGRTGAELVGAADLDGFALGHPMAEVIARLITASQ